MLPSSVSLLILLYLRCSSGLEEDGLGNALNSIENRQKLLASNYYPLPNKDSERRGFQVDDDSLMYLGDALPNYDAPYRHRFLLGTSKPTAHSYEDDYGPGSDTEEYQRAFNERLLDQFLLDVMNGESDDLPEQRARKRSFFREREISEIADNLQDLQPGQDVDERFALDPRFISSKPHSSHRRVSQPQNHPEDDDEDEDDENYNTIAAEPSWREREDLRSRNQDPEAFDQDELDAFFRYLAKEKDYYANEDDVGNDDARQTFKSEADRKRDSHLSKFRRLGSHRPSQIRKRSTSVEEKPKTSSNRTSDEQLNATSAAPPLNTTSEKTTIVQRGTEGQLEVPVDLKSSEPLNIKKKSIDWSNYFGVDKRQKKSNKHQTPKESSGGDASALLDQYIQSYILQSVRDSAFNNRWGSKRMSAPEKYEQTRASSQTADDLRSAEDMIIDRVLKYTGAHQGVTDPQALRRYKERVIDELGAAYSLEKLRNNIDPDNPRMKRQHPHTG